MAKKHRKKRVGLLPIARLESDQLSAVRRKMARSDWSQRITFEEADALREWFSVIYDAWRNLGGDDGTKA